MDIAALDQAMMEAAGAAEDPSDPERSARVAAAEALAIEYVRQWFSDLKWAGRQLESDPVVTCVDVGPSDVIVAIDAKRLPDGFESRASTQHFVICVRGDKILWRHS